MGFFVSDAWAQAASATAQGSSLISMLPLLAIFALFYFLLIRPQTKRTKEHRKMVDALAKNDEVVTGGGLVGKIVEVEDSFVMLQIAEGVKVKVQKSAVTSLLPKGTISSSSKD